MNDEAKSEWLRLGEELRDVSQDKFDEVLEGLRDLIEAQRIIARFDWQLMFRGRPSKRYSA